MQKAMKVCRKVGCNELTRNGYCDKHIEEVKAYTQKKYDRLNRNQKARDFYQSKEWWKARAKRFKADVGLCVRCRAAGKLVKADVVHHKVELLEDWSKRADQDNLESLCHGCHNHIHKRRG